MNSIKVFCPATIANISCGFDVLGLALESVGDLMTIKKQEEKGINILEVTGQDLPLEAHRNVAGVAGMALLQKADYHGGFSICIDKKIKAGSGIGSSAASSAGAVWAMNELLGQPFTKKELVQFAMEGERLASGVAHADNVASALYGGFTLIRSYNPLDIIHITSPGELVATVIHPQIEIKTSDSRKILKTTISLEDGIKQWGNLGGLIAGLYTDDYSLIGRSLEDHIVEPIRSILIPGFDALKKSSLQAGALGCGISGSGPSVYALSRSIEKAREVADAMKAVYDKLGIVYDLHVSEIGKTGVRVAQTQS
ncbi:homoserine kinase [Zeaxanthinibacter sp. PT1]|uniref:homoserine kinase n=1 Tax=Zeaxanthinibacter TaxID=561554 RepID=UPI00234908C1|nr:homoserine kinase [Zeaxanthinibacter sp. PT1]MDC6352077.1 homoserine kinase [Zeaxanthinibacter sp. PT1]